MNSNFVKRAEQVADEVGVDFGVVQDNRQNSVSEDDGNLQVVRGGTRVWFGLGQELSRGQFNKQATRVLRGLGFKKAYKGTGVV